MTRARPSATCDQAVGDLVEEVAVVADDQHGPLELVDRALERLAGPDVEVVGRLVHDQQVGGGGAEAGQGRLGLLAAGELADGLEDDARR